METQKTVEAFKKIAALNKPGKLYEYFVALDNWEKEGMGQGGLLLHEVWKIGAPAMDGLCIWMVESSMGKFGGYPEAKSIFSAKIIGQCVAWEICKGEPVVHRQGKNAQLAALNMGFDSNEALELEAAALDRIKELGVKVESLIAWGAEVSVGNRDSSLSSLGEMATRWGAELLRDELGAQVADLSKAAKPFSL